MDADQNTHEENLSEQLQRLLMAIEASGRAILPRSNDILLKSIVEAAARIFGAAAASILLVNEERAGAGVQGGLWVLRAATWWGPNFRYDKGIAGYVFMTGMPIATSNVREDKRFNQDFAKSTGYVPNSILASPLHFRRRPGDRGDGGAGQDRCDLLQHAGHGADGAVRPAGRHGHRPVAADR